VRFFFHFLAHFLTDPDPQPCLKLCKAGIKDVLINVMRVQFWNNMRIAKKPISNTTSTFPIPPRPNKPRNFLNWIWSRWVSKESSLDTDFKKVNLPLWQNAPKTRYFETKMAQHSSGALLSVFHTIFACTFF
jgi:hypothetical protein